MRRVVSVAVLVAMLMTSCSVHNEVREAMLKGVKVGDARGQVFYKAGVANVETPEAWDYWVNGAMLYRIHFASDVVTEIEKIDDPGAAARSLKRKQIAKTVAGVAVAVAAAAVIANNLPEGGGYRGSPAPPELVVFSGDTFLGCLNCSQYDSRSILNANGAGSKYSSDSVTNAYSEYGSKYSDRSACNPYASAPPAVVDRQGNFYGYLTVNAYKSQINDPVIRGWLAGVCAEH